MASFLNYAPGTALAQGMQAGFQAAGSGLQNQNLINQLEDWRKNAAIRDLTRIANEQKLRTNNQLEGAADKALLGIQQLRPQLYGSPTGYVDALNKVNPLNNGLTRRLSSDGKTIETVNALGQVLGTTPNLSGRAAEAALLNSGGISLNARAAQLPEQEKSDAHNLTQLQVAKMHADASRDVAELGLKAARASAAGAAGGKPEHLTPEQFTHMVDWTAYKLDMMNGAKLPWKEPGKLDTSMLKPDQAQYHAALTNQASATILGGATQGMPGAFSAAQGLLNQAAAQNRASEEEYRKQQSQQSAKAKQDAERAANLNAPTSGEQPKVSNPDTGFFTTTGPRDISQYAPDAGIGVVPRTAYSPDFWTGWTNQSMPQLFGYDPSALVPAIKQKTADYFNQARSNPNTILTDNYAD